MTFQYGAALLGGVVRPPEGTRIPVRIPADLLAEIDRRAVIEGVSRAAIIRRLLKKALK